MKRFLLVLFMLIIIFYLTGCFGKDKNEVPVAEFSCSDLSLGKLITFDASGSFDREDEKNLLARWDFDGDGFWDIDYADGKRIIDKVTLAYVIPGTYDVSLEVKDTNQMTKKITKKITIGTETVVLKGYVVESRGGVGIAEAKVMLSDGIKEYHGVTSDDGSFAITAESGVYQLTITREGYSTTRVQNLYLGLDLEYELNLPLWEEFYQEMPNCPPEVIVSNFEQTPFIFPLSGEMDLTIEINSELGTNLLEVAFGHQSYSPDYYYQTKDSCEVIFDSTQLPNGWNYIRVSAYDINYNFVEMFQPVYIQNPSETNKLSNPQISMIFAMTFGKSLQLMSLDELKFFQQHLPEKMNNTFALTEVNSSDRTIFVEIVWTEVEGAEGYRIYRSFDEDDGYRLIGTTTHTSYTDLSSLLVPDKKVFYRVSAYNSDMESELSQPAYTIPLKPFNVNLLNPGQDSVVRVKNPVFEWTCTEVVGDSQSYEISVQGVTDEAPSMYTMVENQTSVVYDGYELKNSKVYEWDIIHASAYAEYTSISFALSASGGQSSGSINGTFKFLTDFE